MNKEKKKGFTLIELLVVVLIIGILAAVALPQYQRAVDKAKFTQAHLVLKSIVRAQRVFWLANGRYATNWGELTDIDIPSPISGGGDTDTYIHFKWGYCFLSTANYGGCGISNQARELQYWASDSSTCYAVSSNQRANEICQAVTSKSQSQATLNGGNYLYAFP